MTAKPSRVVTYNDELLSIKSHDRLVMLSIGILIFIIRFVGLERKHLGRHQLLVSFDFTFGHTMYPKIIF